MNDTQPPNRDTEPHEGPPADARADQAAAPHPPARGEMEEIASSVEGGEAPGEPESEKVHLPIDINGFSGPLDLLVNLIATHERDIQEVAISEITGTYLSVIRAWHDKDLNLAGEYLVLASTLMRYKSRSLLPREETPDEEEETITDEMLRQRQLDYERFRQAAMDLRERKDYADRVVPRLGPVAEKPTDVIEYSEVSVYDLYETFKKIIADLGEQDLPVIEDESYSVDEKMIELESFLNTVGRLHLPSYLRTLRSKLEVIVVFLALLELMRLRVTTANQEKAHADIWIVRHPNASDPIETEGGRPLPDNVVFEAAKEAAELAEEDTEGEDSAESNEAAEGGETNTDPDGA